jgi:hypothetical protein
MFTPPTILGLAHDYANLSIWLDENLIPEKAAEFRKAESQCFSSNENVFENRDMGIFFKRGFKSLVQDPIPASVMREAGESKQLNRFALTLIFIGVMGRRGTPKVPWYLFEVSTSNAEMIKDFD